MKALTICVVYLILASTYIIQQCLPFTTPPRTRAATSLYLKTALLWLDASLRIDDNPSLKIAAEHGKDGLTIFTTWPHKTPITPAQSFHLATLQSLNSSLNEINQTLTIVHKNDIPAVVEHLNPSNLIIDSFSPIPSELHDKLLLSAVPTLNITHLTSSSLLHDHSASAVRRSLGRTRRGGKVLRWSTYLTNMIDEGVTEPIPKPTSLPKVVSVPPQLCTFVEASSTNWSKELIELWGPITESEAKRR